MSVITGTMAVNVLKKRGKSVLPVYITRGGEMIAGDNLADITAYKNEKFDGAFGVCMCCGGFVAFDKKGRPKKKISVGCAINCCHGGVCEGGAVAGLCAVNNVPLASAGMFESAAFMDKYYTKLVLQSLGVKVAKYGYSRDITGAICVAEQLGYPVIVKPARLGSSIGIAKAEDKEQLKSVLQTAFALDSGVLIEEFLSPRREINCAAYFAGGEVRTSLCEEAFTDGDLLSYDDKYTGGDSRQFPADLTGEQAEFIRGVTAWVYQALGMRGIVRFDFILRGEEIFVSEINTVPGSLSQYLVSDGYDSFSEVLLELVEQAIADKEEESQKIVIKTGILNNVTANACKIK